MQLADLAGLNLDPWQQLCLRAMLRQQRDGQWAAFESCMLVPRQNGKSVVLEAYDLAKLFLSDPGPNGHLILHSAHLFPTAMESFRHLGGLIRNTPELWGEVVRVSRAHGEEGFELANGNRLRFAARTVTGSGRGFSPDDVVLDEAFKLPHEALSALMPALSARPNPQLIYASSTGYPDSEILWTLVERGRAGDDPTLAYMEWCADTDADLDDVGAWAQANPALGFRLTEKKIAAERASMRDMDFARERLGLWADTTRKGPFRPGAWEACADPASQITGPVTFAVEVSEDRDWGCIASAGAGGEWTHGEVVDYRPGTKWIPSRVAELAARHVAAAVVIQPSSPAGSLIQDILDANITVHKASVQEYAQACGMLFDAVEENTGFRHISQGELDFSVASAQKKTAGDAFVWNRRGQTVDISPLAAVTLAVWGHKVHGSIDVTGSIW